ncbi:MAG TPA: hypothetical protein DEP07_18595, partial [Brevibacillus sp.]|nr:hypothetical protein [Brevibacillus sp.]
MLILRLNFGCAFAFVPWLFRIPLLDALEPGPVDKACGTDDTASQKKANASTNVTRNRVGGGD